MLGKTRKAFHRLRQTTQNSQQRPYDVVWARSWLASGDCSNSHSMDNTSGWLRLNTENKNTLFFEQAYFLYFVIWMDRYTAGL
jgi:hypothetical protein